MLVNKGKTLTLKSQVKLGKSGEIINLDMTAEVEVEERRKIQFTNVKYQGDEKAKNLGKALISHVNDLLDLDKFALDGTQLKVDRIRIRNKEFIFYGIAKIDRFPERKK